MGRFLNVLRSWLLMVSVIAMGNTVQSFRDHSFLSEKLYTGTPEFVNGLQARTFGIWTFLSSIIRCACAIDIQNRTLYHVTLWTFVLALGHFLSEAFIYKTAPLTIGVMAPLIVASEFLHRGHADWVPVHHRVAGSSRRPPEEAQLRPDSNRSGVHLFSNRRET
uniref:Ergosterol biosynthetic protein 28 n=1 Tax=Denticeps clupeoides TaxID=299321 RepID=A0AAY4C4P6_9TELE